MSSFSANPIRDWQVCTSPVVSLPKGREICQTSLFTLSLHHIPGSWLVLSTCFLLLEVWDSDNLFLFSPVSFTFNARWQFFADINSLKNVVASQCMSWGFTSLGKGVLQRSFLRDSTSLPICCWEGWGDPWITHLFSSALANSCPFGLLSRTYFPSNEFLKFSFFFAIWIVWECFHYWFLF